MHGYKPALGSQPGVVIASRLLSPYAGRIGIGCRSGSSIRFWLSYEPLKAPLKQPAELLETNGTASKTTNKEMRPQIKTLLHTAHSGNRCPY